MFNNTKIAITGHRPNKLKNDYSLQFQDYGPLKQAIYREIEAIVCAHKAKELICGLALGVDQILACVAMRLDIMLTVAIPFIGQERMWPKEAQKYYNFILEYATKKIIVCEGGYAAWKMQKRNIWMVDQLDVVQNDKLIAVWDGTPGGTKNCYEYAVSKIGENNIIRINPNTL